MTENLSILGFPPIFQRRGYIMQNFDEHSSRETSKNSDYIFVRYRREPHTNRLLDAQDYGHKAWKIPVRRKKN